MIGVLRQSSFIALEAWPDFYFLELIIAISCVISAPYFSVSILHVVGSTVGMEPNVIFIFTMRCSQIIKVLQQQQAAIARRSPAAAIPLFSEIAPRADLFYNSTSISKRRLPFHA